MTDTTHLVSLQARLSSEKTRLASAKNDSEREARAAWVAQLEREIDGELRFLGMSAVKADDMSDDDLLADLMA